MIGFVFTDDIIDNDISNPLDWFEESLQLVDKLGLAARKGVAVMFQNYIDKKQMSLLKPDLQPTPVRTNKSVILLIIRFL